jgi:hypothetical protein
MLGPGGLAGVIWLATITFPGPAEEVRLEDLRLRGVGCVRG